MKKLVIAGLIALTVSVNSPASADAPIKETATSTDTFVRQQSLVNNTNKMNAAVRDLKKTVGRTWYIFSGNTPSGWDCSGLTMWFYGQMGIELEHRASIQQMAGEATETPVLGDIVVFRYKGSKTAYHVGIYIGNGKMIHAPNKKQRTAESSVLEFGGDYSVVTYRHLVDTL